MTLIVHFIECFQPIPLARFGDAAAYPAAFG